MSIEQTSDELKVVLNAAKNADWQQVVLNGGPPCFHIEDGSFCFRAERWQGHEDAVIHPFVSLEALLRTVAGRD